MSRVYISCYRYLATDESISRLPAPQAPSLSEDSVEITRESVQSKPFPPYTKFILVKTDGPCSLAFGQDPVADPMYHYVEGGEVRYYGVSADMKLAVIMNEGLL